jgi:hypothetical protein
METTWKPVTAGIINITVGILNVLGMFVVIMLIAAIGGGLLAIGRIAELIPIWMSGVVQGLMIIIALIIGILGVLPLIGGIYAVQRKNWRLALTGSIVAILSLLPAGITSTVLIVLAKDEFE